MFCLFQKAIQFFDGMRDAEDAIPAANRCVHLESIMRAVRQPIGIVVRLLALFAGDSHALLKKKKPASTSAAMGSQSPELEGAAAAGAP
jgi:hypothetical protein